MTILTQSKVTGREPRKWSDVRLWRIPLPVILLGLIVIVAAALRFYNISAVGDANQYYTAAVKAMLQSWHNFFFVAAEPGGSVTVDKPPLGLWLQAISAAIFGVNGVAVVLPQILAGTISVPVLYVLVKRYLGPAAGLIAAFAQAVAPVAIAVERDNTMDATLILFLLLAAWAFIKATDSGKLRWLMIGAVLVGLGFNTKMMQAFLPVPAFFALYFFGAKVGWLKKIGQLALTMIVLLAVSLSWAIAVDLTPADQRPYVGSSSNNTELNLLLGYNGLNRLVGNGPGGGGPRNDGARAFGAQSGQALPGSQGPQTQNGVPLFTAPGGFQPNTAAQGDGTQGFTPPSGAGPQDGPGGGPGGGGPGGGGGGFDLGERGPLRMFSQPLANEISWLLPFGLLAIAILAIGARFAWPLEPLHQAAILFGGWLVTEVIFFSVAGFFHPYYLAMLAPPLAALVGLGVAGVWQLRSRSRLFAGLLIAGGAGTLAFQVWLASQYAIAAWWYAPAIALMAVGIALMLVDIVRPQGRGALLGYAGAAAAILVIPALWAGLTTFDQNPSAGMPHAYSGSGGAMEGGRQFGGAVARGTGGSRTGVGDGQPIGAFPGGGGPGGMGGSVDDSLLTYLQANTQGMRYMVAVQSSMQGAGMVIRTGRGVLYMGGFNGQDKVIDAEGLQKLVDAGELRYILSGGSGGGPGGGGPGGSNSSISSWLQSSCKVATGVTTGGSTLYECSPSD